MKWQEIINVKATRKIEPYLISEILSLFNIMLSTSELVQADVRNLTSDSNNLLVALEWDTKTVKTEGSSLAKILSHQLKPYGAVDLSIWTEKEGANQTIH